jgi:putative ABC transport system permease protein
MLQLFLIAARNLLQHSRRTLLLGGAIAGVTLLFVFLQCLSTGIHETMLESATTLSTGHLNVAGFYKVTAGQSAPVITQYKKLTEIVRKTLPDLDFVAQRGRGWAKMVSDTGSMQVAIGGIDIANEPGFKRVIRLQQGKLEDLSQPGTVLIFSEQAKKLDVKVGDAVVLSTQTTRGVNNTIDVRVVAVAQDIGIMSSWNVFVPDISLRLLNQTNADTTGALHVYLKNIDRIPQDMGLLRNAFSAAGFTLMEREAKPFWQKFEEVNREDWTGQRLDLTTWDEEVSFFKWQIAAVDGLMYILVIVLLIIISVGIMNSMWIAIRERTREIGTLRAIGMQRARVLSMFVIEAFTLSFSSTVIGAAAGLALSEVLNLSKLKVPSGAEMFLMSATLKFGLNPGQVIFAIAVITICTTLISIIPSIHAARMKPITAMQHLG